jgi:3-methyladenine DNA glycosylase AlkD
MPRELIADIQARFATLANPHAALSMSAYMRDQFPFLGIATPARRAALNDFKKHALSQADLLTLAQQLWQLSEREYRYAAIDLLAMHSKQLDASAITTLFALARTVVVRLWVCRPCYLFITILSFGYPLSPPIYSFFQG